MSYRAVIFDIGGVVVDSPLHVIARFEREHDIPAGHVNRVVVDTGPAGAWSRLERGEVSMSDFFADFDRECAQAGHPISTESMMAAIAEGSKPRPMMLHAIGKLRSSGFKVAALTNNWVSEEPSKKPADNGAHALKPLFDVFVESSVVGLRKPDPRIYEYACEKLGVELHESVFLDDIGSNLKAARALGMHTIKVDAPELALTELAAVVGLDLREA